MNYLKDNEIRTELKVYWVELLCPECKKGKLVHQGEEYVYGDTENSHYCNNYDCYYHTTLGNYSYPHKEYIEVEYQRT